MSNHAKTAISVPNATFRFKGACLLGAAAGALLLAAPAIAQNADADAEHASGITDIIVTASRMGATALQSTPLSVSAMSADELGTRGIRDVRDLKSYVPSLQVSDQSGYTQLYMRGIGSNTVFIGSDPSTTIHLDGVYMARPLSYAQNFLDVERIEVLRGPQGTLYGRNSVGGTINIISKKPAETPEGQFQAGFGTHNRYAAEGYLSGPIGDNGFRASIAFDFSGHSAFRKNISTGQDVENLRSKGVRAQLYFPIGDTGEWIIRGDWSRQAGALGTYPKLIAPTGLPDVDAILGDFSKVAMDDDNWTVMNNTGLASDFTIPLGDEVTLKSLTAYRRFSGEIINDADASPIPMQYTQILPIHQWQISQEFTVNGKVGAADFVLGAFYFEEKNQEPLTLALQIPGLFSGSHIQRPDLDARSFALYGQTEYHLSDQLSLTAGIRWTTERKHYQIDDYFTTSASHDIHEAENAPILSIPGIAPDPFRVDVTRSFNAVTPKFGINYKPRDGMLLYVSATRGFKSGGFDYGSNNAADAARGYGPEKLWSYEAGVKSDWFDRRLRVNLTGFFYDYTDLQVESLVQIGASFGARTENAATAHVKGIELEVTAQPVDGLTLTANGSWLDAKYKDYKKAYVTTFGDFDASGKRLNNAPVWSGTLGFEYETAIGNAGRINFGADTHLQSTVYFTAANDGVLGVTDYDEKQKGYAIVNARIGWTAPDDRLRVELIATNIFNRDYIVGTANYTLAHAARPGRPSEVFGQISYRF